MKAIVYMSFVGLAAAYATNGQKALTQKRSVDHEEICSMNYAHDTVPGGRDTSWGKKGKHGKNDTTWKQKRDTTMRY